MKTSPPIVIAFVMVLAGCGGSSPYSWKAGDYFKDSKVIALCHAIDTGDLAKVESALATGADPNAVGSDGMTPLLWAFAGQHVAIFKKLLDLGGDPNVVVGSEFNSRGSISTGHAVTHLSAMNESTEYFLAVMSHGGDPHLTAGPRKETLIHLIIKSGCHDKPERITLLLDQGADIDQVSTLTPTMQAVSWGAQYELALFLLDRGANLGIVDGSGKQRLVHFIEGERDRIRNPSPAAQAAFETIVKRLEARGESLDEARKDMKRWHLEASLKIADSGKKRWEEREAREKAEQNKVKK